MKSLTVLNDSCLSGMNLASGLENFSHAMWLVTASSALLATSVTGLYLRKVRKLSPVNSQREGRGNLWEVLDAGTSTVLYTSDSTVSEDRFRKLCKDVTGKIIVDSLTQGTFLLEVLYH